MFRHSLVSFSGLLSKNPSSSPLWLQVLDPDLQFLLSVPEANILRFAARLYNGENLVLVVRLRGLTLDHDPSRHLSFTANAFPQIYFKCLLTLHVHWGFFLPFYFLYFFLIFAISAQAQRKATTRDRGERENTAGGRERALTRGLGFDPKSAAHASPHISP